MSFADDIASLERYAAFLTMPGDDSSPTLTAMARQLPHLLACAKFVEEHGDTTEGALYLCSIAADNGLADEAESAGKTLEALRRSRSGGGT